ncbi:MAG: hypothetical protein IPF42_07505 [Candidatus Microthrix sp.]|nr:hypothetical protein [Candidatus Microthrix sp.]
MVWLFALPVAVWLWAVHLPHERRAPALTFAGMVTVFCLAVPVAAGVGERTAADAAADLADASASTTRPNPPESGTHHRTDHHRAPQPPPHSDDPLHHRPPTTAPPTAAAAPHPPLRPRRLLRRLHPAM